MSNKIRSKKHLGKYADAARLLHPDMNFMWVDRMGNIKLSEMQPDFSSEFWGLPPGGSAISCPANLECKLDAKDSMLQLRSTT